jgi:hypothetical protein
MEKRNITRVSMNLNDKAINRVNYISEILDEPNKTRVVTTALVIAKTIIEEIKKGKTIILRDKNGYEESVKFTGL